MSLKGCDGAFSEPKCWFLGISGIWPFRQTVWRMASLGVTSPNPSHPRNAQIGLLRGGRMDLFVSDFLLRCPLFGRLKKKVNFFHARLASQPIPAANPAPRCVSTAAQIGSPAFIEAITLFGSAFVSRHILSCRPVSPNIVVRLPRCPGIRSGAGFWWNRSAFIGNLLLSAVSGLSSLPGSSPSGSFPAPTASTGR